MRFAPRVRVDRGGARAALVVGEVHRPDATRCAGPRHLNPDRLVPIFGRYGSPGCLGGPFPVPGLMPPTTRTGAMRRIGDVIVQLGFAERGVVERVVAEGGRAASRSARA